MITVFQSNFRLLKGIAVNRLTIHQIETADIYYLPDQNRLLRLKRVQKALLHDAAVITVNLAPEPRKVFKAAVDMACGIQSETDLQGYVGWLQAKVTARTDKEWKQLRLLQE